MEFVINIENNKNLAILHVLGFLGNYDLLDMKAVIELAKRFRAGRDIELRVPADLADDFKVVLLHLECVYESRAQSS